MKRLIPLLFVLLTASAFSNAPTCAVTGTFYDAFGRPLRTTLSIEPIAGALLYDAVPATIRTNSSGQFTANLVREAWYRIYANIAGMHGTLSKGVIVYVPDAAAAEFTSIQVSGVPQNYVVAVPVLTVIDSTTAQTVSTDSLRFGSGLKAVQSTGGSGTITIEAIGGSGLGDMLAADSNKVTSGGFVTRTLLYDSTDALRSTLDGHATEIGTATTTANAALSKSDTTALHAQKFAVLNDQLAGKGDADSLQNAATTADNALPKSDTTKLHAQQFAVLRDQDAGKPSADSVHTAIDARLPKSDTTSLHAQIFAVINDRLANKPEADSLSTVLAALLTKADTANQARVTRINAGAVGSSSRIYVSDDSIATLSGAINIDASTGNVFRGTTSGNTVATITNMLDGQSITIKVEQGGTHTFTIAGVAYAGGTVPTLTSGAGARDVFTVIKIGGELFGSVVADMR